MYKHPLILQKFEIESGDLDDPNDYDDSNDIQFIFLTKFDILKENKNKQKDLGKCIYVSSNLENQNLSTLDTFHFLMNLPSDFFCSTLNVQTDDTHTTTLKILKDGEIKNVARVKYSGDEFTIRVIKPEFLDMDLIKIENSVFYYKIRRIYNEKTIIRAFNRPTESIFSKLHKDHPFKVIGKFIIHKTDNVLLRSILTPQVLFYETLKKKDDEEIPGDLINLMKIAGGVFKVEKTKKEKYTLNVGDGSDERVHNLQWIAPWAKDAVSKSDFIELDCSFYALSPYVYCIPQIIINNESLPIGISIGPTEKALIFEKFYELLEECGIDGSFLNKIPILSDEGSALISFANNRELIQFFCYKHIINKMGPKSYLASCTSDLLYSPTKEIFMEKFDKFRSALEEIFSEDQKKLNSFCDLFEVKYDLQSKKFIEMPDFEQQSLWKRCEYKVSTCSNHCESLHQKLNLIVSTKKKIISRLYKIIKYIFERYNNFGKKCRNFENAISFVKKQDFNVPHDEHCTFYTMYPSSLYGVNFPCVHNLDKEIEYPQMPEITFSEESHFQLSDCVDCWDFKYYEVFEKFPKCDYIAQFMAFYGPPSKNIWRHFRHKKFDEKFDEEEIDVFVRLFIIFSALVYGNYPDEYIFFDAYLLYFQEGEFEKAEALLCDLINNNRITRENNIKEITKENDDIDVNYYIYNVDLKKKSEKISVSYKKKINKKIKVSSSTTINFRIPMKLPKDIDFTYEIDSELNFPLEYIQMTIKDEEINVDVDIISKLILSIDKNGISSILSYNHILQQILNISEELHTIESELRIKFVEVIIQSLGKNLFYGEDLGVFIGQLIMYMDSYDDEEKYFIFYNIAKFLIPKICNINEYVVDPNFKNILKEKLSSFKENKKDYEIMLFFYKRFVFLEC